MDSINTPFVIIDKRIIYNHFKCVFSCEYKEVHDIYLSRPFLLSRKECMQRALNLKIVKSKRVSSAYHVMIH